MVFWTRFFVEQKELRFQDIAKLIVLTPYLLTRIRLSYKFLVGRWIARQCWYMKPEKISQQHYTI